MLVQESAPAHGTKQVQIKLKVNHHMFISSDIRPSTTPNPSVCDFSLFSVIEEQSKDANKLDWIRLNLTPNIVNTLHGTLACVGLYIFSFLKGDTYKFDFLTTLKKIIYQSLDPYDSKSKVLRENRKKYKLHRINISSK